MEANALVTRLRDLGFPRDLADDPQFQRLATLLFDMQRVAIAYSGGVDSTFLLYVASRCLKNDVRGVLALSDSLDRNELRQAQDLAARLELPLETIETREFDNPEYRRNDANRCYHCKSELFEKARAWAAAARFPYVADGSNADDVDDYRPGLRARSEQEVRSPLLEAGLDKVTIRRFSRRLGLPTWDKPAAPCLSSRVPYGSEVTDEKLRQIEAAEGALRQLGYRELRVRHHGDVARLELPPADIATLAEAARRATVVEAVKSAGFLFVALDLEGFRSGSLNQALGAGFVPAASLSVTDAGGRSHS